MRRSMGKQAARTTGFVVAIGLSHLMVATPGVSGTCEPLSPLSQSVTVFGTDYLPRIDLQSGSDATGGCALPLPDVLPNVVSFPVWAYNLHGEMTGARFRIVSSAVIEGFDAAPGLAPDPGGVPAFDGRLWHLDVQLTGVACGPALLGEARITVQQGSVTAFVDVAGYGGTGAPVVTHAFKGVVPAVVPRHGAFAGEPDPFHCQLPLCREPNAPVTGFVPLQTGGFLIELGWTAGGGGFTMIRYRTDGVPPSSVFDGSLLTVVPTLAGQAYAVTHENPQATQYWYAAFAVDMSGDEVTHGSRLECDSFTTATVDESIPVAGSTWGRFKQSYR